MHNRFQNRQQRLQARQLAFVEEDVGVFQFAHHLFGVGDEIGRQIAAVELHAFDDIQFGFQAFVFFDGDGAFVADLVHRFGDHLADFLVAVGGDGADLRDFGVARDFLGTALRSSTMASTALSMPRLRSIGFMPAATALAFARDRLRQNGRGGGAVAGLVVGLRGDFAHHLGAHIFELVGELDFLGDGDAVLGDARRAKALFDHDIAALGAERDLHRVGENVDAAQHFLARVGAKFDLFGSHCVFLLLVVS